MSLELRGYTCSSHLFRPTCSGSSRHLSGTSQYHVTQLSWNWAGVLVEAPKGVNVSHSSAVQSQ